MPEAHAAVVEAMAAALCGNKKHGTYQFVVPCAEHVALTHVALAALVRSDAVRVALVKALVHADNARRQAGQAWSCALATDAILAALAPPEAS